MSKRLLALTDRALWRIEEQRLREEKIVESDVARLIVRIEKTLGLGPFANPRSINRAHDRLFNCQTILMGGWINSAGTYQTSIPEPKGRSAIRAPKREEGQSLTEWIELCEAQADRAFHAWRRTQGHLQQNRGNPSDLRKWWEATKCAWTDYWNLQRELSELMQMEAA